MSYYLSILQKQGLSLSPLTEHVRSVEGLSGESASTPAKGRYYGGGHPIVALTQDGLRICCRCKVPKPASAYTKNRNKKDGLDARCRECKSQVARQRYLARR
jgi:hypothetical protein